MTKKSWIIFGILGIGVTSFAVGVSIAITTRNHKRDWKISIANDKGARYLLTQLDPFQNKAKLTSQDKQTWDIIDSNENKDDIAKHLGIKESSQVQLAISKNKPYTNGLEKLFYDLTKNIKKNADQFTLEFTKSAKGEQPHLVNFNQTYVDANLVGKKLLLDAMIIDETSTLVMNMMRVYLHNKPNRIVAKTTHQDIKDAWAKIRAIN